jgi:hypothetical protein
MGNETNRRRVVSIVTAQWPTIRILLNDEGDPFLRASCAAGARNFTPSEHCKLDVTDDVRCEVCALARCWVAWVDWTVADVSDEREA